MIIGVSIPILNELKVYRTQHELGEKFRTPVVMGWWPGFSVHVGNLNQRFCRIACKIGIRGPTPRRVRQLRNLLRSTSSTVLMFLDTATPKVVI